MSASMKMSHVNRLAVCIRFIGCFSMAHSRRSGIWSPFLFGCDGELFRLRQCASTLHRVYIWWPTPVFSFVSTKALRIVPTRPLCLCPTSQWPDPRHRHTYRPVLYWNKLRRIFEFQGMRNYVDQLSVLFLPSWDAWLRNHRHRFCIFQV